MFLLLFKYFSLLLSTCVQTSQHTQIVVLLQGILDSYVNECKFMLKILKLEYLLQVFHKNQAIKFQHSKSMMGFKHLEIRK